MTPAEREELKKLANLAASSASSITQLVVRHKEFHNATSPEAILHLLDLISSLELTLYNANGRITVLEVAIEEHISDGHHVGPRSEVLRAVLRGSDEVAMRKPQ